MRSVTRVTLQIMSFGHWFAVYALLLVRIYWRSQSTIPCDGMILVLTLYLYWLCAWLWARSYCIEYVIPYEQTTVLCIISLLILSFIESYWMVALLLYTLYMQFPSLYHIWKNLNESMNQIKRSVLCPILHCFLKVYWAVFSYSRLQTWSSCTDWNLMVSILLNQWKKTTDGSLLGKHILAMKLTPLMMMFVQWWVWMRMILLLHLTVQLYTQPSVCINVVAVYCIASEGSSSTEWWRFTGLFLD